MSDQPALLAAIRANPDDDTPRLMYADWLDENLPDKLPSPSSGPSARAEYIRVQCRLAQLPFDDPVYPELREREQDLAVWLGTHTPKAEAKPDLPDDLDWFGEFDAGELRTYARGFPEEIEYTEFGDDTDENVERILEALPEAFDRSTTRSLRLEDAYGEEIVSLMRSPVVAGLRGLSLSDIADENEGDAVRAIATCRHLSNLRHLFLDSSLADDDLHQLARSTHLTALENLSLDYPTSAGLKALGQAKWFRNLRSLRLWLNDSQSLKALAEVPEMPNLVSLELLGGIAPTVTAVRKLASTRSFPKLARLAISHMRLSPEALAALARGSWPLRHLMFHGLAVKKAGAEVLAGAEFAETLRVLDLSECDITAGGIQALAASGRLAGLRHLDLENNPVGVSGLAALARSPHLRGLRMLNLAYCNSTKAPLDAAALLNFLTALEMPDLKHLKLNRLPVAVRGARALASNASFAGLTHLEVPECGLRENGTRALIESGAFPHLAVFNASDNAAGKGVSKLADPKVFPRLGRADVTRNRIPKGPLARLNKRPGVQV